VKDLLPLALNGISSSVIFYGASKSGKSYSMRGLENKEKGVIVPAVEELLDLIEIQR